MSQHYSDPSRANDPTALPDIEVFEMTAQEVAASSLYEDEQWEYLKRPGYRLASMNSHMREAMLDAMVDELGIEGGWFYWFCFPGCMPDSEPIGPYASKQEAISAAQVGR